MKRNLINLAAILAASVLAGLGVATVTVGGTAASAAEMGAAGSAVSQWYDFPADEKAAVSACYKAEREARGIPSGDAYVEWWYAHEGTPERADWHQAFEACQDAHLWQHGKWNWDYMVPIAPPAGY